MKIKTFFYVIMTLCLLSHSCKENIKAKSNTNITKTEKENSNKEYKIPLDLIIEKKEEINIDNDESKEIVITAVDKNADYFYEFWFKNDKLIYQFKYPWGTINKKWIINLDNDDKKEIVRIQGYEDGVDYVIYDIVDEKQIPVLYFNPALEDDRYPNQVFWAYPNDITDLVLNNKNEIRASLNNTYLRDDSHTQPTNQKELPFLFFNGHTTQPHAKVSGLNKAEFMPIQAVINKVKKNSDISLSKKGSLFNSWQNDQIEIHINTENISYLFNGQCIYAFPVKILSDTEIELIWGEIGMDCVNDMQFSKTFGLSKDLIPQKGKAFAKYTLKEGVVYVTYYYNEWVTSYKKQINIKPFMNSFHIKK